MDPSTGTFTTMGTYGGSLSDPMSLHKYLFANANPVKYSDPSGHFSLVEFEMTEAIDEILMSSLNYGFAYIGLIQNSNTSANNGEKLAGYFVALGLGLLMPVAFSVIAMLPFVTAILVLVLISECMIIGSIYAIKNKHEIAGALMGIIGGDAAGKAFGLVVQNTIRWMNKTDSIIISVADGDSNSSNVIGGHNLDADQALLGKYYNHGGDCYTTQAGSDCAYFDMGEEWNIIQNRFGYSDREMFEHYNVPFLEDQIGRGHDFYFTVDPTSATPNTGTQWEYDHLVKRGYYLETYVSMGQTGYVMIHT